MLCSHLYSVNKGRDSLALLLCVNLMLCSHLCSVNKGRDSLADMVCVCVWTWYFVQTCFLWTWAEIAWLFSCVWTQCFVHTCALWTREEITWLLWCVNLDNCFNPLHTGTHPNSSWLTMWVSYYSVPLWLLQVRVPLMVLWGYFAATACVVASQPFVTIASEYPHSTLKGTATCSSHSGTL